MLINGGKKKKVWRGKNRMGFIKPAAVAVVDEVGPSLMVAWYVGRKVGSWQDKVMTSEMLARGTNNVIDGPGSPLLNKAEGFLRFLCPLDFYYFA